jgi:hypothetical protein
MANTPRYDQIYQQHGGDPLFMELLRGIVGGGTVDPYSVERALSSDELMMSGKESSSRKMGKNERMVPGAYTLAKFPGMEHQLFALRTGAPPKGFRVDPRESMGDFSERKALQNQFANTQEALLGMRGVDDTDIYKQFMNRRSTRRVGRGR